MPQDNIEYKGYNITIVPDEYSENPRHEWDNFGVFIMAHKNYMFADKGKDFKDAESLNQDVKDNAVIALPVYMYDHSGITISTNSFNCQWDSGQIGFIYATAQAIRGNYNDIVLEGKTNAEITEYIKNPPNELWRRLQAKILKLLKAEIRTLDQYVVGDIWHYNIENNGEDVDSCGGFYGYDTCLEEAKITVDWHFAENYPILAA